MMHPDHARPLDTRANPMQVVAGVTTDLRHAISADAPARVERESAVDRVVQAWTRLPPTKAQP